MLGSDALAAFYLALDEHPGDRTTLLVLADWYEEYGRSHAAACLRWTVEHDRHPFRYTRGSINVLTDSFQEGWFWWALDDPSYGQDWGHPRTCRLPVEIWKPMRHTFAHVPALVKEYPSTQDAYLALIEAWPLARPAIRRERRW